MEEAIFIKNIKDINEISSSYNRIYYGEEFCENRLPSPKEYKKVCEEALKKGKGITIVFPYLTDNGINKIKLILEELDILLPSIEVVANDWGTIHFLKNKYPEVNIVVGRLLNRMKRDPRIKAAQTFLPEEIYEVFKSSNLMTPISIDLLESLNIKNIEFDFPLQGVNLIESNFKYSVHYPFGYITTTRLCIKNKSTYGEKCNYTCDDRGCTYSILEYKNKSFPCRVFQKGNTVFYYNNVSKEDLIKQGFKRIINHKEI